MSCSNAHQTLGMRPAPNGSAKKQYKESLAKRQTIFTRSSESTDDTLRSNSSLLDNVHPKYHVRHWIDTHGPIDQLEKIQKSLMHAILPKMGYSSKTCRHVIFGPRNYLGIGGRHLLTERGVQQMLMFVKHIRSDQARPQQASSYQTRMVPTPRRYCQTNP